MIENTNKVYSAWIDLLGKDAGTVYVCAQSPEEAMSIIRSNCSGGGYCTGDLRENSFPAKYYPSETYLILGNSEGILFAVDEKAEEEARAAAESRSREEEMREHLDARLNIERAQIKEGVFVSLSAFDIARIGKDEMYKMAEEAFIAKSAIFISINEMTMSPISIKEDEVQYLCHTSDYTFND